LQTLDDDDFPDNGISITANIRALAQGKNINFNTSTEVFESDEEIKIILSELTSARSTGARTLVPKKDAALHFQNSIFNQMANLRDEMDQISGLSCTADNQCTAMAIYNGPDCPFTYIPLSLDDTSDPQAVADLISISYKLGSTLEIIKNAAQLIPAKAEQCPPGPKLGASLPLMACVMNQCTAQ